MKSLLTPQMVMTVWWWWCHINDCYILPPEPVSGPSCSCYHSFLGEANPEAIFAAWILPRLSLHFAEPPCELPALEPRQQAATAPGGVEQVISWQGAGRRGAGFI